MEDRLTIGFIGNPNCGKTTLFNAYTGAGLKVANWPGVTVEKVEGHVRAFGYSIRLVDLPGIYSLTSYTMEEQVAREFILSSQADVIVDVADASLLERSLYLTLQLLELGKPVVLALNMMDLVEKKGRTVPVDSLRQQLGVVAVPVSGKKRTGLDALLREAVRLAKTGGEVQKCTLRYRAEIERDIRQTAQRLVCRKPGLENPRWYALKLLEKDPEITRQYPDLLPKNQNWEREIIHEKYRYIQKLLGETGKTAEKGNSPTDKLDRILTHGVWGVPVFLAVMGLVFFLTFAVGGWLRGYLEAGMEGFSQWTGAVLLSTGVNGLLRSVLTDGILAGVGSILSFLPNILILFLALALLEDSGYMARVAYVMEGIMSRLGLSGRAFIPMVLGFGCSVPAIMASRSLENRRDRFKVMLVTPFMSCSARLPIYILFSELFFPEHAMLAAYSMYLLGVIVAVLVAAGIHLLSRNAPENPLLMELPDYKIPSGRTVFIYVWEKVRDYLTRAGTTIFLASIFLWWLLNFGPQGGAADLSGSYGALLGRWLCPVLKPVGLGFWQIAVALIAGISAKEVVVSSCAVLFQAGNLNSLAGLAVLKQGLEAIGFGKRNGLCMMVFCLLYIPCAATLAVIRRESGSTKWMLFAGAFQLAVAWLVTFAVYHGAGLWL